MTIKLYELAGADDDRRFSPYCWRIRYALQHKGLDFETIACRFTDKHVIAFSGQDKVPVLADGDEVVSDSWAIACHLERAYPDRPSLFGGPAGLALSRFYVDWADTVLHGTLIRLLASDIHAHLHEKDKDYFRETRERRFGTTLEAFSSDQARTLQELKRILTPLRRTLQGQPYLGGDAPLYADYTVMGAFMWARCVSQVPLLESADPVTLWRSRLLDLLDEEALRLRAYG
ncbi:glutathione S-transferase family protein [Microvirga makkahensis]|uniref:Glutathione S-transferase family protein n=1 Tax=Microvirga makkahensis TaxID=1128670 RepID=A0A7X3MPH9_9HYPH|nr:glutathione S-transferase family protein [Microvirga makkahensis]MXQ10793.1 glutathione S-transferase family protein [Microvirga makkahensis]